MKKIIFLLVVVAIALGAYFYTKKPSTTVVNPDLKTYRSTNLGLSFSYPKILAATTTSTSVTLHHEVPFTHHDFCDFVGESTTTISTLTDFHARFYVVDKKLIEAMKTVSPYIPEENFVNDEIVPSPGFIDKVEKSNITGYSIFEGAEGCGHTIYYLKISDNRTLVIVNDFITIFSGSLDTENMSAALAVPGVINKEKAAKIFDEILKTIKTN